MEFKNLTVKRVMNIGLISFCRPKYLNALNTETLLELDAAIAQLEADEIFAHQVADWLLHAASDDRLGHPNFNSEIRKELSQAIAYASGYLRNLK